MSEASIEQAAKLTLMEMLPRVVALGNRTQQFNRELFPDDDRKRVAADIASLDMLLLMLVAYFAKRYPEQFEDLETIDRLKSGINEAIAAAEGFPV